MISRTASRRADCSSRSWGGCCNHSSFRSGKEGSQSTGGSADLIIFRFSLSLSDSPQPHVRIGWGQLTGQVCSPSGSISNVMPLVAARNLMHPQKTGFTQGFTGIDSSRGLYGWRPPMDHQLIHIHQEIRGSRGFLGLKSRNSWISDFLFHFLSQLRGIWRASVTLFLAMQVLNRIQSLYNNPIGK